VAAIAATALLTVAGCGGGAANARHHRTLTVLAASSLSGTFSDLAATFEAGHPGVRVRLVFDSSATLAQQAIEHAPGDVLATADRRTMDEAAAGDGIDGEPSELASNVLVLAVPRDNPAGINAVSDLDDDGVDYLTCVSTAPCGAAAAALLRADGIARDPASEEVDVKSVLDKLEEGEADAGFVYRTDVVASAGQVSGIEVPGASASPNTYWIARTARALEEDDAGELAGQWVEFLSSAEAQDVLRTAGFETSS
jgi:molybdate transport system substrate-binding protein